MSLGDAAEERVVAIYHAARVVGLHHEALRSRLEKDHRVEVDGWTLERVASDLVHVRRARGWAP